MSTRKIFNWKIFFVFLLFFIFFFKTSSQVYAQRCDDTQASSNSTRCVGSGGPNPTYTCQTSTATGGQCSLGDPPIYPNCWGSVSYGTTCNVSGGGSVCTDDYAPRSVCCTGNCGGSGGGPTPTPGGGGPNPTPFYLGCSNGNCVRFPGTSGPQTPCGAEQNLAPACTHRACQGGACVLIPPAGVANSCNVNADCCNPIDSACTGAGAACCSGCCSGGKCSAASNCTAPPVGCNANGSPCTGAGAQCCTNYCNPSTGTCQNAPGCTNECSPSGSRRCS